MPKSMTKTQYNSKRTELGLSIVGAAPALGVSRRQAQRFASGEADIPATVAKLVTIMVKHHVDPADKELEFA